MTGPALGLPGHRVAQVIWGSMVVMLLLFLGVVIALGGPPRPAVSPDALLAVVIGTSVFGALLTRVLPQRLSPRAPDSRGDIVALTRLCVAWSLCEAVAIFPLIAFLMTRDLRLLPVFVADVVVLLAWWPTRARWHAMSEARPAVTRGRMVR